MERSHRSGRGVDLILTNGKVTDGAMWPQQFEALAIHDGRIVGLGTNREVSMLSGRSTTVVDAGGRRVIPGLIDGHLHVVRSGLSYGMAVSWAGIRSLNEGFERLREANSRLPAGQWLYVPGGWTDDQVDERRGPTRDELDSVAGDRPTYVQCAYRFAVLNTAAVSLANLGAKDSAFPEGSVEIGPDGPTGRLLGVPAYQRLLDDVIGGPTLDAEVNGTARFLDELRRLGLTGAIDAGGFRTKPESYDAVYALRARGDMGFRLRLYVHPGQPGEQVEQTRQWVRHARVRSGDPLLQIIGLGEVVHYGCHDQSGYDLDFRMSPSDKQELGEISQLASSYGWAMHAHAIQDSSISDTLDAWESIDDPARIAKLRFSIAHGELASDETLTRLARLGAGLGVQARMYDTAVGASKAWGNEVFSQAPRLGRVEELGIPLGGGTDGAVGHTYNPWEAISWFVTGRSVAEDVPVRDPAHRLSRARALDVYTNGSAWFSFEENERGRLAPGYMADVAILAEDYFEVEDDRIQANSAWMTIVDGVVEHQADD